MKEYFNKPQRLYKQETQNNIYNDDSYSELEYVEWLEAKLEEFLFKKKYKLQKRFENETGWVENKRSPIESFNRIMNNFICPSEADIYLFRMEYLKAYVK